MMNYRKAERDKAGVRVRGGVVVVKGYGGWSMAGALEWRRLEAVARLGKEGKRKEWNRQERRGKEERKRNV